MAKRVSGYRRKARLTGRYTGDGARPENRWVGVCPTCGKHMFPTRREARNAWKSLFPGQPISVYPCGEYFHFGNNSRKWN